MNTRLLTLALAASLHLPLLAADSPERYGLEAAKKAMANFKMPTGLGASLFAAEPMIQNPTNIEIDHLGRVWATECVDYRSHMKLRPEGDRVVILQDTDGDGLADKETTFYQSPELTNPLGLCVLPGPGGAKKGTQVIVSAAPNVWLLTDSDGDDKADRAEILLKVSGNWNHDHQVHAFVFGPDGKLYFNIGNESREIKWPDGTLVVDAAGNRATADGKPYRQGMIFRCDLVEGKIKNVETLGWNFRNNYEVCVDSFGAMWQSDNDDDGNKGVRINYVMDHGNYGYTDEITGAGWQAKRTNMETEIPLRHWHLNDPGTVPNLLQTGAGSPTGILVNEGSTLGAQFTNQLIHCDAGPRTVRAYPVKPSGAGYTAEMVDILTSSDAWYRPSDVSIAPDGALFVADWYDPGVGGHGMGDHEAGKVMGRIYRVSSAAKSSVPTVDVSTPAGAVSALGSPNQVARSVAWTALHAMGAKAEPALLTLWKSKNPRLRARAMGVLAQIPGSEGKYIQAAAKDASEDVQCFAFRLMHERIVEFRAKNAASGAPAMNIPDWLKETAAALFAAGLQSPSPAVRRQTALSLRGSKHAQAASAWAALAVQHDGKDRWYLEALGIGSVGNEDAFFDAWIAAVGDKWNTPAGRDIIWRTRAGKATGYLVKLLSDASTSANEKPRYVRAFDFLPASDARTQALVQMATGGAVSADIAAEALIRLKGSNDPLVVAALKRILEKAVGTAQFVELAKDFGASGQGAALLETAMKIPSDPAAVDAIKLLLNDAGWEKLVDSTLSGPNADTLLGLLAASGSARGSARVIAILSDAQRAPEIRKTAVQALARTQAGAEAIVKLAREGKLDEALKPVAGSALRLVQYGGLKTEIDHLFPAAAALGGKPLPPIAELVKLKGDVAKGKAIAERAESSCVLCHRIGAVGVDFAPALSEIGAKLPKEAIFDAILNPNTSVTMGFETTQLSLKDGGTGMGIVRSETADEVVLGLPGGVTQKFDKKQISKRTKLPISLMPSGLNQALSQEDIVNLVEYLATLKKQ